MSRTSAAPFSPIRIAAALVLVDTIAGIVRKLLVAVGEQIAEGQAVAEIE